MKRVFLGYSYNERNREFIRKLKESLKESSRFEVVDFAETSVGNDPVSQIHSEIEKADIFLAIFERANNNVFFELGLALGSRKQILLAGREPESLPSDLRNLLYVSLSGDLVEDLTNVLSRLDSLSIAERVKPIYRSVVDKMRTYTDDPSYFESISAAEFEDMIIEWFEQNGFRREQSVTSRDWGVDLIARSPVDQSLIVVEAKKFSPQSRVSIKDVMALLGAAAMLRASKGILITSSSFTRAAIEMASESKDPRLLLLTMDELIQSKSTTKLFDN